MSQIRVLIADDDTMVRIGFKSIIDWEKNGFVLVGEAKNGTEALEMIARTCPDIVITDIKMPGMDGIALIETLKKNGNTARILVLSSYDDFDLVKKALKLGAEDYLLKLNLDPADLIASLHEVVKKGLATRVPDDREATQGRTLLREKFLRDVVSNFYTSETELEQSMREIGIQLDGPDLYCLFLKIGDLYRFEDMTDEAYSTLRFSVVNIAEEIANDVFYAYGFAGKTGEFYILAAPRGGSPDKNSVLAYKTAVRMRGMLAEYLSVTCVIGIGRGGAGLAGIQQAYRHAVSAVQHRFYTEQEGVLEWDGQPPAVGDQAFSLADIHTRLYECLRESDTNALRTLFTEIENDIDGLDQEAVCNAAVELAFYVQEYFDRLHISAEKYLPDSFRSYRELIHMENLRQVRQWLQQLCENLAQLIGREKEARYPGIISEAVALIDQHFCENLSLVEVASHLNLNPSYFSTLLKKYTGCSFTELIGQRRIEQAKKQLCGSNEKIYKIGRSVGYDDKCYFNRIFKQMVGVSPGEYREREKNRSWERGK